MNIVVIDDDVVQLDILTGMIKSIDPEINVYHSIDDVVDKDADIIILDLYMPEKDGFEICEELKSGAETKDIPIFILSSSQEDRDKEDSYKAGAIDYIEKPVSRNTLERKIRRYVNLSTMIKSARALSEKM